MKGEKNKHSDKKSISPVIGRSIVFIFQDVGLSLAVSRHPLTSELGVLEGGLLGSSH